MKIKVILLSEDDRELGQATMEVGPTSNQIVISESHTRTDYMQQIGTIYFDRPKEPQNV